MVEQGLDDRAARRQIFMVDREGLLVEGSKNLRDFQARLVQSRSEIASWSLTEPGSNPGLYDVMANADASVLIGASGISGLFTEAVIKPCMTAVQPRLYFLSVTPRNWLRRTLQTC